MKNTIRVLLVNMAFLLFFANLPAIAQQSQAGTILRLEFWNIRDFSDSSRDTNELHKIAAIIHPNDCVAICEVNDKIVLGKLTACLATLGGQWSTIQTKEKVGNSPSSAEHYGFVYRSDKLKVKGKPRVLKEKNISTSSELKSPFDREPFVCSFTTLDGRFDFTVAVVHITWGHGISARKAEIRTLKSYFEEVQRKDRTDNDVILCGDFNRNVGDIGSLTELLRIPSLVDTTSPNVPTTLGTANTYDHLLFQTNFVVEYTGEHGVEEFDTKMFNGDLKKAEMECSDHRPVWITVRVPERDDD